MSGLEKKYRAKAESVDFRPKTHGWKRYALRIRFENGREYLRLATEDPYLRSFLYGKYTVRDYCMDCKFPECHASDLTIADFWLYEKLSSLRNDQGISLILCNTPKGKQALDGLREQYIFADLDTDEAVYNNRVQIASERKKSNRKAFLHLYEKNGLHSAYREFFPHSIKQSMKNLAIRHCCRKRGSSK